MSIERVFLSSDGDKLKHMSSAFLNLKYRLEYIRGLQAYLCSYTSVGNVGLSPFQTYFNLSSGFLQSYFQEFELMFPVHRRFTLVGYAAMEWNKGSTRTQLSTETYKPLDQKGTGLGFGLDVDLAENAGIYIRHRWMEHKDDSFVLDQFKGQETVVEIKISF
jgi:hypothetical protein